MKIYKATREGKAICFAEVGTSIKVHLRNKPYQLSSVQSNASLLYVLGSSTSKPFLVAVEIEDNDSRDLLDSLPKKTDTDAVDRLLAGLEIDDSAIPADGSVPADVSPLAGGRTGENSRPVDAEPKIADISSEPARHEPGPVKWSPPLSGSMSADFDKSLPDVNRGIKGDHGWEVEFFRPKVSMWTGEEKVRDGSSVAKLMFFTPALLVHGTPKLESAGHGVLTQENGDLFMTVPGEVTGFWQNKVSPSVKTRLGRLIDMTILVERNFKSSITKPDGTRLYVQFDLKVGQTSTCNFINAVGGSIIAEQQAAEQAASAAGQQVTPSTGKSLSEEIRELAKLRDEGLINDDIYQGLVRKLTLPNV